MTRSIEGLRVTIVGMARSGVAAAELAQRGGALPFVSESAPPAGLAEQIARLESVGIPFEVGGHTDRAFDADLVVTSPGVPPGASVLQGAREHGLAVHSELEFAWWSCEARVLAVTGTNGKTTTTALCGAILDSAGLDTEVCGNIGRPFSLVADSLGPKDVAVVEVSSYQLATSEQFRPDAGAILNLQPDHLAWHGSLEAYYEAKLRIAAHQRPDDLLVTNADDPLLEALQFATDATRKRFSVAPHPPAPSDAFIDRGVLVLRSGAEPHGVVELSEMPLKGMHNAANAAAAALLCVHFGATVEQIATALRSFSGVEHRLEDVGEVAGVLFVNDSKATNVDSVCVALRAMERPVHLIMGGRDKGASYAPIAAAGSDRVLELIVIGEAADRIQRELSASFPVRHAQTLQDAVHAAYQGAHEGDVVLLSPGCSSFDMFIDFEHRGAAFKAAVRNISDSQ
jgi:UDP-N-acetylmuramoylalanine--D-glutamate ligase